MVGRVRLSQRLLDEFRGKGIALSSEVLLSHAQVPTIYCYSHPGARIRRGRKLRGGDGDRGRRCCNGELRPIYNHRNSGCHSGRRCSHTAFFVSSAQARARGALSLAATKKTKRLTRRSSAVTSEGQTEAETPGWQAWKRSRGLSEERPAARNGSLCGTYRKESRCPASYRRSLTYLYKKLMRKQIAFGNLDF